jgi:hypothetical protein
MITLRVDVDYAYPSRTKSFIYTYLRKKSEVNYLAYPKLLAEIINQATVDVRAYWFFNLQTLPDKDMLSLINSNRHEIGLHVINHSFIELYRLKQVSPKPIEYYTIHGTERLLGQIIWHRNLGQKQAVIPPNFPLQSFHKHHTRSLDWLCYHSPFNEAVAKAKSWIKQNYVLEVHPEWLINHGDFINHRGPYIDVLKTLLTVSP